jgi:hypothetical protein
MSGKSAGTRATSSLVFKSQTDTLKGIRRHMGTNVERSESIYTTTCDTYNGFTTMRILEKMILALTGRKYDLPVNRRTIHTVGLWRTDSVVLRASMLTPDLATGTVHLKGLSYADVNNKLDYCYVAMASPRTTKVTVTGKGVQLQGRMAPYVCDMLNIDTVFSHINLAGSKLLFTLTTLEEQDILCMSMDSMYILSSFAVDTCIITIDLKKQSCRILADHGSSEVNEGKNTCVVLRCNGGISLQGKEEHISQVCKSFRESLLNISRSRHWRTFICTLVSYEA